MNELKMTTLHYSIEKPFLQTGEDFEHSKTLNFIRDRLVEVHGEPKNLDYMHKLNNAIAFVERMEDVKKNCGGIEPKVLRGAVEIKQEKPKRTKVSYEKVEFNHAWLAVKSFEDGVEVLYRHSDLDQAIKGSNWKAIESSIEAIEYLTDTYSRIETEITEREEFIDELTSIQKAIGDCHLSDFYDALYDSGKFKLVN